MQVIENAVDIDADPQVVFDFCSDMRTEPEWNPAVTAVTLLTPEPVAAGSRFEMQAKGMGRSTVEIVEFAPPATWSSESSGGPLSFRLVGRVDPRDAGGARLTVRIELRATGVLRPLEPVVAMVMRPTSRTNATRIRELIERRSLA